MNNNGFRFVWLAVTLLLVAAAGFFAFNAGTSHGIALSGKLPAPVAAAGGAPYPPYAYPAWGWHRPFGFGFFLVPLFLIAFWMVVARGIFWRRSFGPYRGAGGECGPGGPGGRLDEWHRRAHERMGDPLPGAAAER